MEIHEQFRLAHELGYLPAVTATAQAVVASPVSLEAGTFLATSESPRHRAVAAVVAISSAYAYASSSARIRTCP